MFDKKLSQYNVFNVGNEVYPGDIVRVRPPMAISCMTTEVFYSTSTPYYNGVFLQPGWMRNIKLLLLRRIKP